MAEAEEILRRVTDHKGVEGIITVTSEGIPIMTTMENSLTVLYASLIQKLLTVARSAVRDLDPQNELTFFRVRTKNNEIMVAPDKDYFIIVIQKTSD